MDTQVQIVDHPEQRRYEARLEGLVVGVAAYRLGGDLIAFTHTEVDPELRGRGIAGALMQFALDDARRRGLAVRPQCSYVRHWIDEHADYADLVAPRSP